jgi:hypothetical protein
MNKVSIAVAMEVDVHLAEPHTISSGGDSTVRRMPALGLCKISNAIGSMP